MTSSSHATRDWLHVLAFCAAALQLTTLTFSPLLYILGPGIGRGDSQAEFVWQTLAIYAYGAGMVMAMLYLVYCALPQKWRYGPLIWIMRCLALADAVRLTYAAHSLAAYAEPMADGGSLPLYLMALCLWFAPFATAPNVLFIWRRKGVA